MAATRRPPCKAKRGWSTLAREAYFLEFAAELASVATMPVMVTGGIRRLPIVKQVLDSGIAMAGIATALTLEPQLIKHWREGRDLNPQLKPIDWKRKPRPHSLRSPWCATRCAASAVVVCPTPRLSPGWPWRVTNGLSLGALGSTVRP